MWGVDGSTLLDSHLAVYTKVQQIGSLLKLLICKCLMYDQSNSISAQTQYWRHNAHTLYVLTLRGSRSLCPIEENCTDFNLCAGRATCLQEHSCWLAQYCPSDLYVFKFHTMYTRTSEYKSIAYSFIYEQLYKIKMFSMPCLNYLFICFNLFCILFINYMIEICQVLSIN